MMRSLISGVSGLRNHQVRMDVIGNNIANVNTLAFKAGRVTLKESFAQLLSGAVRPQEGQGGINSNQVGLGVRVGSIDTLFTQGSLETTGNTTDLAIQGDGFFVLANGSEQVYSRAGNFEFDGEGRLVSATNGFRVQGRTAVEGVLTDTLGDIRIPVGQKMPASATTQVTLAGNLDTQALPGTVVNTALVVYDSLGQEHELKIDLTKSAAPAVNEWTWSVDDADLAAQGITVAGGSGTLSFDTSGRLSSPTTNPVITIASGNSQFSPMNVTIKLGAGDINGLTQLQTVSNAVLRGQNGFPSGMLQSFSIDHLGIISGAFTNGTTQVLGKIAMAEFNNPSGMMRMGDSLYSATSNSGEMIVGYVNEGISSTVSSGDLEMSNVDLSQEFTNMIIAQRGFQANGRVVTSTDEMLQEIVNLKR